MFEFGFDGDVNMQIHNNNNTQVGNAKNKLELNLNMKQISQNTNPDYQDEFMSNYDQFSKSWRDQIDKNQKIK